MSYVFSRAKTAIDKINELLTGAGYTVVEDKAKFQNYAGKGDIMTVTFDNAYFEDVEEMASGKFAISVLYKHSFNTDGELLTELDTIAALFCDYTLQGAAISFKRQGCDNYWLDNQRKRSICVLEYALEV